MSDIVAIIPARLGSTRFPRKVLYPYRSKPLLFWVYRDVRRSKLIDRVIVATDSAEIQRAVEEFGGEAVCTSTAHTTGSDRVAEVVARIDAEIIVNVQADNFGLQAPVLDRVLTSMQGDETIEYATLAYPIEADDELVNPNLVKVVKASADGRALWFSRSVIPYVRDGGANRVTSYSYLGHIGVYFYRREALRRFALWPRTETEQVESLEQLRILENGERMIVYETEIRTVSVDAPEDVKHLDSIYI